MAKKGSFIGKVLGVAAGYAAVNMAGVGIWYAQKKKQVMEHENESNLMQAIALGSNKVLLKNNIQNAYISCLSGSVTIDFEGQPEHEDIFVDLFSALGKVTINLPEEAALDLVGEGRFENVQDNRPEEEKESRYTVHVTRQSTLTALVINSVAVEQSAAAEE